MAEPLTIKLERTPRYRHDDHVEVEVHAGPGTAEPAFGGLQRDRVLMAGPSRAREGFGFGNPGRTLFGVLVVPGAEVIVGAGLFGQGGDVLTHTTLRSFVAGDYDVRVRAVDRLGNAGDFSPALRVEHRPDPPPPTDLAIAGATLSWSWSDP